MRSVVVMGVSGCGKSTVGEAIAHRIGAEFCDGDDFHSEANIAKMAAGIPLDDGDRWPWLAEVGQWLGQRGDGVIACSALKRSYRDAIRAHAPATVFVHLAAPAAVLAARVEARRERDSHYAGPDLLPSQFDTLEALGEDEDGIVIDVGVAGAEEAASAAVAWLAG